MQDWDRLAMLGVGLIVSVYTGWDGYKLWKRGKRLAVVGVALLILTAVGVPAALALFV